MAKQLHCLRCRAPMEYGYIPYYHGNGYAPIIWYPGEPERSFWTGLKVRKANTIPVRTFRCPKCGYLESYATKESTIS